MHGTDDILVILTNQSDNVQTFTAMLGSKCMSHITYYKAVDLVLIFFQSLEQDLNFAFVKFILLQKLTEIL